MANLQENPVWENGIYQFETTDLLQGGENGIDNKPTRQLANRTAYLKDQIKILSAIHASSVDGMGRDILAVLGVSNIADAMAEIRRRCNNDGEIDASNIPAFGELMVGDYIDGLDLSGITAPTGGQAPQAWNNTYKNNRIVIAGFNTYKSMGSDPNYGVENNKNHILFVFRNCIAIGRINSTNDNTGGYVSSQLRTWLENSDGRGGGLLSTKLKEQLGGEYLYSISKYHSTKGGSDRAMYTLWLPSEIEIFGMPLYGDEGPAAAGMQGYLTPIHIPIFQESYEYRIRKWNGARYHYWTQTPYASLADSFCNVSSFGASGNSSTSSFGGVAPAFCVA